MPRGIYSRRRIPPSRRPPLSTLALSADERALFVMFRKGEAAQTCAARVLAADRLRREVDRPRRHADQGLRLRRRARLLAAHLRPRVAEPAARPRGRLARSLPRLRRRSSTAPHRPRRTDVELATEAATASRDQHLPSLPHARATRAQWPTAKADARVGFSDVSRFPSARPLALLPAQIGRPHLSREEGYPNGGECPPSGRPQRSGLASSGQPLRPLRPLQLLRSGLASSGQPLQPLRPLRRCVRASRRAEGGAQVCCGAGAGEMPQRRGAARCPRSALGAR